MTVPMSFYAPQDSRAETGDDSLHLLEAPEWHARARCKDMDRSLFFPPPPPNGKRELEFAMAVCRRCPVRLECYEDAISHSYTMGVWGGRHFWFGEPR